MSYQTSIEAVLASTLGEKLAAVGAGLMTAHTMQAEINQGLKNWNAALIGIGAIFVGSALLKFLNDVANAATAVTDVMVKLEIAGANTADILALRTKFYKEVQGQIPTTTAVEYMRRVGEMRQITGADKEGWEEAQELAIKASMVNELLANLKDKHAGVSRSDEYFKVLRAEELKGIATDPARREKATDLIFSYVYAFANKLTTSDMLQLAKRSGSAWIHADLDKALGPIATLAADIGGEQAGRTLGTMQQLQLGTGSIVSGIQLDVMRRAGLLVTPNLTTPLRFYGEQPSQLAMVGAQEHIGDIPGWIKDVIAPAIHRLSKQEFEEGKGHGATEDQIYQTNMGKLFRHANAQKLALMFSDAGFLTQITKDMGIAAGIMAKSIADHYKSYITKDPVGVEHAFGQAYESMMAAIGAPVMQVKIPIMIGITAVFQAVAKFADNHETAISAIAGGFAALAALGTGSGLIFLAYALGPVGWLVAIPTAIVLLVAAFAPETWSAFLAATGSFFKGDMKGVTDNISKLGSLLYEGISNALVSLWDKIKEFITSTIANLWGKPNPHMFQNPNPFLVPLPGESGLQETAYRGGIPPGSPLWRKDLHDAVVKIAEPRDMIEVNHVTQMKTGEVVAQDTSVHQEDEGAHDEAVVPVSPTIGATEVSASDQGSQVDLGTGGTGEHGGTGAGGGAGSEQGTGEAPHASKGVGGGYQHEHDAGGATGDAPEHTQGEEHGAESDGAQAGDGAGGEAAGGTAEKKDAPESVKEQYERGGAAGIKGLAGGPSGPAVEKPASNKITHVDPAANGSAYLASVRKSQLDEINKDPALRKHIIDLISHEQSGERNRSMVLEAMSNRARMLGTTLRAQAYSAAFYGPIKHHTLTGNVSKENMAIGDRAIGRVFGGQNLIESTTDQGSINDPNFWRYAKDPGKYHTIYTKGTKPGPNMEQFADQNPHWGARDRAAQQAYDTAHRSGNIAARNAVRAASSDRGGVVSDAPSAVSAHDSGDVAAARRYLSATSAGSARGRAHDIADLHPAFALRLAAAIKEARARGISDAGVFSGARPSHAVSSAFDRGGRSLHPVGLAADIWGIQPGHGGGSASRMKLWSEIAARHGLYRPWMSAKEQHHWQPVGSPRTVEGGTALRQFEFDKGRGQDRREQMWRASGIPIPSQRASVAQTTHAAPPSAAGVKGLPGSPSGPAPNRHPRQGLPGSPSGPSPVHPSHHHRPFLHRNPQHTHLAEQAYSVRNKQPQFTGSPSSAAGVKGLPGSPSGPAAPRKKD